MSDVKNIKYVKLNAMSYKPDTAMPNFRMRKENSTRTVFKHCMTHTNSTRLMKKYFERTIQVAY